MTTTDPNLTKMSFNVQKDVKNMLRELHQRTGITATAALNAAAREYLRREIEILNARDAKVAQTRAKLLPPYPTEGQDG